MKRRPRKPSPALVIAPALEEGTGVYIVGFNRDVSGCAYSATIGSPSDGTALGDVDVAFASVSASGVTVETSPRAP